MDRSKFVQTQRRNLSLRAHDRWKGFQPDPSAMRGAEANRDGSVPRPKIAPITPEQRARFEIRQKLREKFNGTNFRELRVGLERKIGATLDFADLPPNEQALKAGRPVVRIVTLPVGGLVPQGFATGFLVAPDLIITNHHVFRTPDEAEGVGAQFLYERTQAGIREGLIFELEPKRFFVNHKRLDYALVAVKSTALVGAPLSQFKFLPLIAAKGKIRKGDPVNIIQHPEGNPKRYATVNNDLLDLRDDGFLLYETDTLEGSSGSPVFNQFWETIGLHHCGVPRIENNMLVTTTGRRLPLDAEVADEDLEWVANEGVRVSAIVVSLAEQRLGDPKQQQILEKFLGLTGDPLRLVAEESPVVSGNAQIKPLEASLNTAMAQNIFHFTGPVTINVNHQSANAEAIPEVTVIAKNGAVTLGAPREAEFREKTLKFDENYKSRNSKGYKAGFLTGWDVPAPTVRSSHSGALLKDGEGNVIEIPYYHYSLVMNQDRRLVHWAASNVDYSAVARKFTKTRKEYGGENWRLDPRVALEAPGLQIEDADFYAPAKKIDRGHIVRREDGCWGASAKEAEFGNSDTYHWTNCTPQSEAFNQSKQQGIWGKFEEHIQKQVKPMGGKMSIFAGPVLNLNDPEHGYEDGATIQVPMEFWKIVLCVGDNDGEPERLAYGFVFDQTEPVERLGFERMNMEDYEIYQMPIEEITKKTGVVFDQTVLAANVMKAGAHESIRGFSGKRISALESVVMH